MEGCRRFVENSVKKFSLVFINECILTEVFIWNYFAFGAISVALAILIGWESFVYLDNNTITLAKAFTFLYKFFALIFTEIFIWCSINPTIAISYQLFVCFTEYPERLKTINGVHYEAFNHQYICSIARANNNPIPPKPEGIPENIY
jgi:hypothetical protein